MNPGIVPTFELPKTAENEPLPVVSPEIDPSFSIERTREILPAPMMQSSPDPSSAGAPYVQVPAGVIPALGQQSQVGGASAADGVVADDLDVVEKEWVERAKKIISLTAHDPRLESQELSKLKATYISKRFGKNIPLAEEKAA
jgi:hypothetical protein